MVMMMTMMMASPPFFRPRPAVVVVWLKVLMMILLQQKIKLCSGVGNTPQPTYIVPQVSIVIPTFERPELLRFALSQLAQSKQSNLEIIIVDDSSTRQSEEELRSLLRSDDQQLVYYYSAANRLSIGQKRNIGAIELATAPYVVHIDDDDLSSIDRIPYQVQPLIDGKADFTILNHGIWIQFEEEQEEDILQQQPVTCYQFDFSKTITPHYGTMAYRRSLHDTIGLQFPDSALGEDLEFYQQVKLDHDIKVLELENNNDHHLYVRHPFVTNRIAGHTNRIPSGLVQKLASCPKVWEDQIRTLSQILFQMQKGKQMVSSSSSSSSSNNRQLQQQSPGETSSSSSSSSYCQCCSNANVCTTMEEAWSMYGCSLSSQICPDVEYWETHVGTCDSCSWGISCTDKYGSYNGCLVPTTTTTTTNNKPDLMPTPTPTRLSISPPPPPQGVLEDCECCLNANVCTTMEDAWNMYGCPIGLLFDDGGHQKVNTCPDVHYWETNVGSCNSCSWGISCIEKYGSYNGCFDIILPPLVSPPPLPPPLQGGEAEMCECCLNANVCKTMEEAWHMYGCPLVSGGSCSDVEYWETQGGTCNSCSWGISCKDRYGSNNGCPLVSSSQTAQTTTSQKKNTIVWKGIVGVCFVLLAVAWWWKKICLQDKQHEPTTSSSNSNNASNDNNNNNNSLDTNNHDGGGSVHHSGMENSTDNVVGGSSTKTKTKTSSAAAVDDDGSFLVKNDSITCEKNDEESLSHQVFSA